VLLVVLLVLEFSIIVALVLQGIFGKLTTYVLVLIYILVISFTACPGNYCEACADSSRCSTCINYSGLFMDSGTNLCKCKIGSEYYEYYNSTKNLKMCEKCSPFCSNCSATSCNNCVSSLGVFKNESGCYCNLTGGYYAYLSNVTNELECSKCSDNCKHCSNSSSNCTSCNSGYYVNYTSTPQSCSRNQILINLIACSIYCDTCNNSATNCTKCVSYSGVKLSGTSCYCDYASGYYEYTLQGSAKPYCDKCDNNCLTCNQTKTNCTSCPIGYILYNSSCICAAGYYNATLNGSSVCLPCHTLSTACKGPHFWQSLSCKSIANLVNGTSCVCKPGFYYENNTCLRKIILYGLIL